MRCMLRSYLPLLLPVAAGATTFTVNDRGSAFASLHVKLQAGESMQVCDAAECWVFHICADDTGASAVWVAKRVPDGHVSAVTNAFVIRADYELASANARQRGRPHLQGA